MLEPSSPSAASLSAQGIAKARKGAGSPQLCRARPKRGDSSSHCVVDVWKHNAAAALGYHPSEGNMQQTNRHASTGTLVTCSSLRGSAKMQSPFPLLHPSCFSAGLERAKSRSYLKVRPHTATNFKCSDRNRPSLILL